MRRLRRNATLSAVPESPAGDGSLGGIFALLLLATFVAYLPSLRGSFLWDDAGHVTSPALRSWSGLLRIWSEPGATQQYYPLLHSAFWLEHQLWGGAALGYRVMNVLWHATAACLFVALLRRLAVPGACLAGLLFALHPVCVESVAWISEQKNTLSTVFYLAAALAFLKWRDHPARAAVVEASAKAHDRSPPQSGYAIATALFVCALLTKTVTATLPAALLVVVWWRTGRLSWREEVRPLLPWFAAGAGAGLFTAWFERTGIGAQGADFDLSFVERGLLAGRVVWFYLGKLVWPVDLMFFYPRWTIDATIWWQWLFPLATLAVLFVLWRFARSSSQFSCPAGTHLGAPSDGASDAPTHSGLWALGSGLGPRADRAPLAVALLFGGTLFPVLGFVNVYPFVFSYVADHFQYLASLPVLALVSAGLARAADHGRATLSRRGAQGLAVILAAVLGLLTWGQSKNYVDALTLDRATLARNPDSWAAHHNLGSELTARGAVDEALPHARRAVELKPDFPEALNNLADNLTQVGRPAEALPLLERALQLQPRYAEAENTLGVALMRLGRHDEGVAHFQRAIAARPDLAAAHYNLGLAHAERGEFAAAIRFFAATARLQSDHAGAELNWGVALALTEGLATARPHFQRALDLDPDSAAAHQTYGRVLLSAGEYESAVEQLRDALQLDPRLAGAHRDLAFALQRLGRTEEAHTHAREASHQP